MPAHRRSPGARPVTALALALLAAAPAACDDGAGPGLDADLPGDADLLGDADLPSDADLPGDADGFGDADRPTIDADRDDLECRRDEDCDDGDPATVERCLVEGRCAIAGLRAANPVLGTDHPDPHVLRLLGEEGRPVYYLTSTIHNGGDIPIYRSGDLIGWERLPAGAFSRPSTPGASLTINDSSYCSIWAPQIVALGPASYLLSFTAERYASPRSPCPAYHEGSGVYLAWSASPTGPFAPAEHPWEPLPAGAQIVECPLRDSLPRSLLEASTNCQGTYCHHIIRLDSDLFRDGATGRDWLAYSWFTNSPTMVAWERDNHGEHTNLVELDAADPFTVICDAAVPQIALANPHDEATLSRLRESCPRCGEQLSMTRGRFDEEVIRDGASWGVVEGANLFRRGGWVYALISGSLWDSAYYHVYWVAAPTVEGLSLDNPDRLVGRYLIPSLGQAFGHGTAVLGPDGEAWYFVHHRLDHGPCRESGACARDVWVSPIEFEDRGDGRGDVWIRPRFPAEEPETVIALPL